MTPTPTDALKLAKEALLFAKAELAYFEPLREFSIFDRALEAIAEIEGEK